MIKAYDGQTVHNSMIDALVAQEIQRQRAIDDRTRAAAVAELERSAAMLRITSRKHWRRLIRQARRDYADNPQPGRMARTLLGLWGLVCYGVALAYHRQDAVLGRRCA